MLVSVFGPIQPKSTSIPFDIRSIDSSYRIASYLSRKEHAHSNGPPPSPFSFLNLFESFSFLNLFES